MNVSLTPQLEALVDLKVKSGRYGSASEVVREALRLLDERDQFQSARLTQLREDVRQGLDQTDAGRGNRYAVHGLPGLAADIKAVGRRRRAPK